MAKSALIGLSDFCVRKENATEVIKIAGITEAEISVKEGSSTFYCDDAPATVINNLEGIEIKISLASLTTEEIALLLGDEIVGGAVGSGIQSMANRSYFSVGFRSQKANREYRYVNILKVKFMPTEDSYVGKNDKTEYSIVELQGNAIPADNGLYMIKVDSDAKGVDKNYVDTFLSTLPMELPTIEAPAPTKSK